MLIFFDNLEIKSSIHPTNKNSSAINGLSRSTPGRIRTPNLLVRSQTLYPVELRAHKDISILKKQVEFNFLKTKKDILFN
tara:strand:- start:32 stop:271 length:240 start_codon:yes stop_codon:yes gene_type:complete